MLFLVFNCHYGSIILGKFPVGTLLANVVGCLLLGFLTSLSEKYLEGPLKKGRQQVLWEVSQHSQHFPWKVSNYSNKVLHRVGCISYVKLDWAFFAAWVGYLLGRLL